jgi:hypothetical protein
MLKIRIDKIVEAEVERLVSNMKEALKKPGSDIERSIVAKATKDGYEVSMNGYGLFLDQGVTGKGDSKFKGKKKTIFHSHSGFKFGSGTSSGGGKDFEKRIDRFMSKNGIQGGKNTNFLIRRSIFQHGIKGSLFASKSMDEFKEELRRRLEDIDFNKVITTKQ